MFARCFRVRLKEAEEEEFHRVDMENRIKNLLSLKNNIESNKVCVKSVLISTHPWCDSKIDSS